MTDIVLKIYSTTTNFGDTLDHTIFGDIVDYEIVDNSNYLVDTAWFRIHDSDHRWEAQITASDGSTLQLWRAFSRSGMLINSGRVVSVYREGQYLIVKGTGMTDFMRNFIVEDQTFDTQNIHYILTDSTNGLLQSSSGGNYLPSATYTSFVMDMFVDREDGGGVNYNDLSAQNVVLDGNTLFDVTRGLAEKSYGANSKPFDFYLFERSTRTGTLSVAGGDTVGATSIDDDSEDFSNVALGATIFNSTDLSYGYITGVSTSTLTFSGGLSGGTADTFADGDSYRVETYGSSSFAWFLYLRERELTPSKKTITLGDISAPSLNLSVGEDAQLFYNKVIVRGRDFNTNPCPIDRDWWTEDTGRGWTADGGSGCDFANEGTIKRVGSNSIGIDANNAEWIGFVLDLTNVNAYNATSTPSALMSSGNGFIVNHNKEQFCTFQMQCGWDSSNTNDDRRLVLAVTTDVDTNLWEIPPYQSETSDSYPNSLYFKSGEWYEYPFRLKDVVDKTCSYVENLKWALIGPGSDDLTMYLDNLHFYENNVCKGSSTDGAPTYVREYLHNDPYLESDVQCNNMAGYLLNSIKRTNYSGGLDLMGVHRDFNLRAGDNVEVVIPSKSINIRSGKSQAKINIQSITYRPNRQILSLGRKTSMTEIINNAVLSARQGYVATSRVG